MSGWSLVYHGYEPSKEGLRETLCALGNGYFVTRGAAPDVDADDVHYPGTYLAGGYSRLRSRVGEREVENEDLVNLPNWLALRIRIGDDEWLAPDALDLLDYRQELDLEAGVLRRTISFRDEHGRTTRWDERRLVSMADQHMAALALSITPEDWSGRLGVETALDGSVTNDGVVRYRELDGRHLEPLTTRQEGEDVILLRCRTRQSGLEVAQAARTRFFLDGREVKAARTLDGQAGRIAQQARLDLEAGQELRIEKVVALHTSRDFAISEPGDAATVTLAEAPAFAALLAKHERAWGRLWQECDIRVESSRDSAIAMKLRLHIFHLLQTVSYHTIDLDAGVPARGWHGEAYRGHVFWDELFVFPFLNLRIPVLARALLLYRYRRLPAARRAARQQGCAGAMFPWQSGSSGREESQLVHLNPRSGRWVPDVTHRQRHINAAIAYNVWRYYEASGDYDFMDFHGAELIVEVARFFASIATYDEISDRFDIRGVMGPDEFHTAYPDADLAEHGGLDNNAYTNVMAAWTLARAQDALALLPEDRRGRLCERIGLETPELERFDHVSRRLRVAFHGQGIISQFEGYERLLEFDWRGARERYGDIQRLDRLLEAERDTPNRYKVSKQADVLMLFYLLTADELSWLFERLGYPFDPKTIPRNVDYYLGRTSHGSTLSLAVHSWVLARAQRPHSLEMFCQALESDIADVQGGTTPEGIHLGAMAGTVDFVQRCYTGIEPRAHVLHFDPKLPEYLERLSMRIRYRRQVLDVEVDHERLEVSSRKFAAAPVRIAYRGHIREISPGGSCSFRLLRPHADQRAEPRPLGMEEGKP